eukprot:Hpha_TRINITY_DN33817_c0_g1::TRINITY_DN33817_c0_g1_i1::g.27418::m.27418
MLERIDDGQDRTARTVHMAGVDTGVSQAAFVEFISSCGEVTCHKLAGDTTRPSTFAFVEYATREGADALILRSGEKLGRFEVRCRFSKKPIASRSADTDLSNPLVLQATRSLSGTMSDLSPTLTGVAQAARGRVDNTVYVDRLDPDMPEGQWACFVAQCGELVGARLTGNLLMVPVLSGFLEFKHKSDAELLVHLSGTRVGSFDVTCTWSRTAIRGPIVNEAGRPIFDLQGSRPLKECRAYDRSGGSGTAAPPVTPALAGMAALGGELQGWLPQAAGFSAESLRAAGLLPPGMSDMLPGMQQALLPGLGIPFGGFGAGPPVVSHVAPQLQDILRQAFPPPAADYQQAAWQGNPLLQLAAASSAAPPEQLQSDRSPKRRRRRRGDSSSSGTRRRRRRSRSKGGKKDKKRRRRRDSSV